MAAADPARAKRISALARLSGPANMAAEKLERLSVIGDTLDWVDDQNKQNPQSWNNSKKILKYFMDSYEEL